MVKKSKNKSIPKEALKQKEAYVKVKQISNPDSPWTITQELLQEVEASFVIANPEVTHEVPKLKESLKQIIEQRYSDDEDTKAIILESIPSDRSIRAWRKKEGWEDAVWKIIHDTGLFTPAKRAEMIESLFHRGKTKSDNAAKMWLIMSKDFSEKLEINEGPLEKFREINKILHSKNNSKE